MTGHILNYSIQTNTAVISGDDGNRYTFSGEEWREAGMPTRGMRVDFDVDGSAARDVFSEGRLTGAVDSGLNSATTTQAPEFPGPAGQVNEPAPEPSVGGGGGERQSTRRAVMPPLEQLVVPALGALVLIASIMLATSHWPLGYAVVLAALGLATIGTYFLPPAVQVEVRIAIAALGLVALLIMFKAFGFWMALLAFVAIGAMQIPYRRTLRTPLHTLEWLKALQSGQNIAETLTVHAETDDASSPAVQPSPAAQPGRPIPTGESPDAARARLGIAARRPRARNRTLITWTIIRRGGSAVFGIIVLLSFLLPWFGVSVSLNESSFGGNLLGGLVGTGEVESENLSGLELVSLAMEFASYDGRFYIVPVIIGIIAALALLGIASAALPRSVSLITGILGVVTMAIAFVVFYITLAQIMSGDVGTYREYGRMLGADVNVGFRIGFWVSGLAFLLMTVAQFVIPFDIYD